MNFTCNYYRFLVIFLTNYLYIPKKRFIILMLCASQVSIDNMIIVVTLLIISIFSSFTQNNYIRGERRVILGFIDTIMQRAKQDKKTIVLPETNDIRTLEAASKILKDDIADLILVGNPAEVKEKAGQLDISKATIVDPATFDKMDSYVDTLVELRKKKGMTSEQAREL